MRRLFTVFGLIALLALLWSGSGRFIGTPVFPAARETSTHLSDPSSGEYTSMHQEATGPLKGTGSRAAEGLHTFFSFSGFVNITWANVFMIAIGLIFIFLAIRYEYEPLLLVPIGTGILIGNMPFVQDAGLQLGVYEEGSVMNYLYFGVLKGVYPPLIFLGIGAMTDFSSLISNPRLMLLGAAAQIGIFLTFLGALSLGFALPEAGAIGIIGGADGPTAIFLSSKLADGVNILPEEPPCGTLSDRSRLLLTHTWPWFPLYNPP